MSKGDETRRVILREAADQASLSGLDGLTIGGLADQTGMSKSGLFRHFGSKEQLQVETLQAAVDRFTEVVIRPTLSTPRGVPRIRALFEHWMRWGSEEGLAGGCIFVAASAELDDRPGPVRDYLVSQQGEWLEFLKSTVQKAIETGAFRQDLDPDQFAYEFHAMFLAFHHRARLLNDSAASDRAREMLERLLADASPRVRVESGERAASGGRAGPGGRAESGDPVVSGA